MSVNYLISLCIWVQDYGKKKTYTQYVKLLNMPSPLKLKLYFTSLKSRNQKHFKFVVQIFFPHTYRTSYWGFWYFSFSDNVRILLIYCAINLHLFGVFFTLTNERQKLCVFSIYLVVLTSTCIFIQMNNLQLLLYMLYVCIKIIYIFIRKNQYNI